jgi:hypothetical protein
MAITQIWRDSRARAAYDREPVPGRLRRGRRAGRQLWTLLHAQGLIKGTAGSRDDVAFVEDDRRRMAGWRAN